MRWKATITYTNGVVHVREFDEFGGQYAEHDDDNALDEIIASGPNFYYIASIVVEPLWSREHAAEMVDGSDEPVADLEVA
jgi:hypothetical protein